VVVVDEADVTAIVALVERYMGERSVDAGRFASHLLDGAPLPHQIVEDLTGANLIARHDALFQARINVVARTLLVYCRGRNRHVRSPRHLWMLVSSS
jgi:hypothetical protein